MRGSIRLLLALLLALTTSGRGLQTQSGVGPASNEVTATVPQ